MAEKEPGGAPKYERVRTHILRRLQETAVQPGQLIASELEVMSELRVSRNTVRRAFDELEREGIIYRKRGKGTFFAGFERKKGDRSGIIGFVIHNVLNNIYPEMVQGAEDFCHERGYSIIIGSSNYDPEREMRILDQMRDRRVEGLIIEPSYSSRLNARSPLIRALLSLKLPFVFTNCHFDDIAASAVGIHDLRAGLDATRYLIRKGHRRIACVYKSDSQAGVERFKGYQTALEEAQLPFTPDFAAAFTQADQVPSPEIAATARVLASPPETRPTAVFFYNDETAIRGLPAVTELGLRIPDDISVIAFDDIAMSAVLAVPLTTFHHPRYEIGRLAAETLLSEIESNTITINHREILLLGSLVERGSVTVALQ